MDPAIMQKLQGQGGDQLAQQQQQEEQRQAQEEMKKTMISQLLTQDAQSRLMALATAKPEKKAMVENMIFQMAKMGRIGPSKLSEDELKALLEQVSENVEKHKPKVNFDRRRAMFDSDDD